MFYAERTDGLLRGGRADRIRQIRGTEDAPWTLGTILDLHCGLLDHAHDVRETAKGTLIAFALKRPASVPVTPVALLAYFMNAFTVASGVDAEVVQCFADLHTPEADHALSDLLESGVGSNQQFQHWTTILKSAGPGTDSSPNPR